MRYEGVDTLYLEGGLLFINTSAGGVVEQRPVAWQVEEGRRRPLECRYVLRGDRVTFEFPGGYDERYPLVIDPVLVFSSYVGSYVNNFGFTATYDDEGHLYGGGIVFGVGYPVTMGVIQTSFAGPAIQGIDMGISKFAPDGTSLVWSTYIGGAGNEAPHSMVVNSANELYIMGTTGSTNFPTTPGCYDASFGGGNYPSYPPSTYGFSYITGTDVVVVHLNAAADALVGSTYVGGAGNDGLNQATPTNRNYGDPFRGEIVLDQEERPLVVTSTVSTGLYTTPGATQTVYGGGGSDAYAFRMDPGLTTMLWATYYGGSGVDAGLGIQVSSTGEIYITGGTTSSDLPSAGLPAHPVYHGGTDGFIARFHGSGAPLLSSTYVGTTGFDQSYFVQLDPADDVFVVGQTTGAYPVTPGKYANPGATQFLNKFSGDLSVSLWSTRIGGTGGENISPSAFLVSNCGQIYFSGWGGGTNAQGSAGLSSSTAGLPVTADAHQSTTDGSDFYLMMLEPEGVALGYATFFGGTSSEHVDGGTSRFDKNGVVYQAVCAGCGSGSYPTTPGAWSSTNNSGSGRCNLGVFKMDFEQSVQVGIEISVAAPSLCSGEEVILSAVGNAATWLWDLGDGTGPVEGERIIHRFTEEGVYSVALVGVDSLVCDLSDTAHVIIEVFQAPVADPAQDIEACAGDEIRLQVTFDAVSVLWSTGDTSNTIVVRDPGEYWFTATNEEGCSMEDTISVVVKVPVGGGLPIPNVFSPNGDGHNDVFRVEAGEVSAFSMEVFDRWGLKVFESGSMDHAWNGELDNAGKVVPEGTYFYVIKYRDECTDVEFVRTGHVTLLR